MPLAVGLVHVALVAPHYFVGSFDDDAAYLLAARALVHGQGLTAHLANGTVMAGLFPPGYSALLAPLVWLWPHSYDPERILSAACYALLFPLVWTYLGRRGVSVPIRSVVLFVLALGPPLATFGSMVMAETPYLVLLVCLLLLVDHWEAQPGTWTVAGGLVVVAAAGLVWLKEAGIGAVAGLVLWYLARRPARSRGVFLGVGVAVLLAPVVVARLVARVPLAGSRYSQELGGYYHGGLADRLIHVVPQALHQLLSTALPATVVPYLTPLPIHGHWPDLWKVLSWHVTVLTVVGAVRWWRRYHDAAVPLAGVYLAETLLWPYINERRVILVLPLVAAWYVLGAQALWSAVRARWAVPYVVLAAVAAAVVVVPLIVQMPRDYLFALGQDSSRFPGSAYVKLLSALGSPADVVESDYLSSTALFTGHRTADSAFLNTLTSCDPGVVTSSLAADHAGFLLLGDVNKPHLLDSPCLFQMASDSPWAVPLLHTSRDDATVFELIGPGTGHPGLSVLAAAAGPTGPISWDWGSPKPVSQVSAASVSGAAALEIRRPSGAWETVARTSGPGGAAYLLASLPAGTTATGLRLVGPVTAQDVVALGG